jgi:hypothetical protein
MNLCRQDDLKDDLEHDLKNAVKCKFDHLLKYCLYLVLEEDSDEKKEVDRLQAKIEKAQSERYYKNTSAKKERARQEETGDDTALNGSPDEKKWVIERDSIMNTILKDTLNHVLPVANQADVKKSLIEL